MVSLKFIKNELINLGIEEDSEAWDYIFETVSYARDILSKKDLIKLMEELKKQEPMQNWINYKE